MSTITKRDKRLAEKGWYPLRVLGDLLWPLRRPMGREVTLDGTIGTGIREGLIETLNVAYGRTQRVTYYRIPGVLIPTPAHAYELGQALDTLQRLRHAAKYLSPRST